MDHLHASGNMYPRPEKRAMEPYMDGPRGPHAPNGFAKPESELLSMVPRAPPRKPFPPGVDLEQVNRAAAEIDQAEKSDVEDPSFDAELARYREKSYKRSLDSSRAEQIRRKVGIQTHIFFLPYTNV
jgi:DNA helicase INO80